MYDSLYVAQTSISLLPITDEVNLGDFAHLEGRADAMGGS